MERTIALLAVVGFTAQIIAGALGMAYGVTSTTFLLSMGISPAAASASVHAAEIFTSGLSGLSHLRLGNTDNKPIGQLLLPGVIGGISGAYVLARVPAETIKPLVAFYLLVVGLVILRRALTETHETEVATQLTLLGLVGVFLDAIGGGGLGPMVTSTLVARGHSPRFTINPVNIVESTVTVADVATFVTVVGLVHWQIIAGLSIG